MFALLLPKGWLPISLRSDTNTPALRSICSVTSETFDLVTSEALALLLRKHLLRYVRNIWSCYFRSIFSVTSETFCSVTSETFAPLLQNHLLRYFRNICSVLQKHYLKLEKYLLCYLNTSSVSSETCACSFHSEPLLCCCRNSFSVPSETFALLLQKYLLCSFRNICSVASENCQLCYFRNMFSLSLFQKH